MVYELIKLLDNPGNSVSALNNIIYVQEMWRQITGVEQPAKKIKLDNNEKLERKRTYDQVKRKSKLAEKPQLVSSQQ